MGSVIAIIGSREWSDQEMVRDYVLSLDEDDTVVSGEARGVDTFAKMAALERGLCYIGLPAEWSKHGQGAAHIRNREIAKRCDRLVAFWDGKSTGTRFTIEEARRLGKSVIVFKSWSVDDQHSNK